MRKNWMGLIVLVLTVSGLAGCASSKEAGTPKSTTPDPVTLKMYPYQPMTENDFQTLIAEPVKKKYPYVTVELMERSSNSLEPLVTAGVQFDLLTIWNGSINANKGLGLFENLTPLFNKNNFDLNRFDPQALDTLKDASNNKEIYGLPYNAQLNALYYNKDIFNNFGVPYPQDGLTWDQTIELAKKVTRSDKENQYRGLDTDYVTRLGYPLSLVPVNAQTNKAQVNSDQYKKVFDLGKRMYSIPGNMPPALNNGTNDFLKNKNVAMLATANILDQLTNTEGLNWDLAQFPSYPEAPNQYGMYDMHVMMITKTSKHKDEALKVLEVFFSDEVQMISTRKTGRLVLLKDQKFAQAFGTDNPRLQGKKLASIFKSKPASCPPFSIYQNIGSPVLNAQYLEYVNDRKDLNSALRDADEEINKQIESQKN